MLGRSAGAMAVSAEANVKARPRGSGPAASLHGLLRVKAGPQGLAGAACSAHTSLLSLP